MKAGNLSVLPLTTSSWARYRITSRLTSFSYRFRKLCFELLIRRVCFVSSPTMCIRTAQVTKAERYIICIN